MRRMGICEEKGSGIDKVVQTVEAYQLAIAATVDEKLVKLDEKVGASRRFARYVPFWA
jgi:hypothetical protein